MQVLNCLIVEDEPLAASLIQDYISRIPGLQLNGCCEHALQAMELMRNNTIDLLFLDVNLPYLNGIDFLKTLNSRCQVVLITAYHEYAVEGFNLNVTDYLLKPVEFSRFLQAVNKVYDKLQGGKDKPIAQREEQAYFFNTDKKKIRLYAEDILYIESLKDYVRIHTAGSNIVTKFQIGELERFLNDERFIRIHKSYIINREKITAYSAAAIELGTISLPLGRTYKEWVEQRLRKG